MTVTLRDITTKCASYAGGDPAKGDEDRSGWLIGPVGRHRDSDLIEESNFGVVTDRLHMVDPEGLDYEIHRFGHWACGWIEEIAYRPGSAVASLVETFRADLDGYPILDEDHLSELECAAENDNWSGIMYDLRRQLIATYPDLGDLDDIDDDTLSDHASGLGESSEGWRRYSAHDTDRIAGRIAGSRTQSERIPQ